MFWRCKKININFSYYKLEKKSIQDIKLRKNCAILFSSVELKTMTTFIVFCLNFKEYFPVLVCNKKANLYKKTKLKYILF